MMYSFNAFLISLFLCLHLRVSAWDYCGGKSFSSTWELCCFGKVVKKSGTDSGCCGARAYNRNWETCCYGAVHKKSVMDTQCCGTQLYNPTWKVCCNGQLHGKSMNKQCCGRNLFDQNFQKCCFGNPIAKHGNCVRQGKRAAEQRLLDTKTVEELERELGF